MAPNCETGAMHGYHCQSQALVKLRPGFVNRTEVSGSSDGSEQPRRGRPARKAPVMQAGVGIGVHHYYTVPGILHRLGDREVVKTGKRSS